MIRPWAVTHCWVVKPQTVRWGPLAVTRSVQTVIPRARLEASQAWRQKQLDWLPRIAHLAEGGRIKLYTTIEIDFEGWGRPGVVGKGTEVDLFRNVRIEEIPPAVDRTLRWSGIEGETKDKKQAFLDSIRQRRYLDLKAVIGPSHAGDIFHLWSAEQAGIECFLSVDHKFINAVNNAKRNRKGIQIKVDALSPVELCERFGFQP